MTIHGAIAGQGLIRKRRGLDLAGWEFLVLIA
jgi:hypothetical protein